MQAWKASERTHWLSLPARVRGNGLLVVTFSDLLRNGQDASRVMARLQAEAAPYFQKIAVPSQLSGLLAQMTSSPSGIETAPEPTPPRSQRTPAFLEG